MVNRVLDIDKLTGTVEWFSYDEVNDEVSLTTQQEVAPITDYARALHNEFDERTPFGKGTFHKVASIPMTLYMQMVAEGKTKDKKWMRAWLNDADNRFFRTRPGVV